MFSPALVSAVASTSPRIKNAPLAVQRAAHDVGRLAGACLVVGADGAPLRSSPSVDAPILGIVPEAVMVSCSGEARNGFAAVALAKNHETIEGWISLTRLVPANVAHAQGAGDLASSLAAAVQAVSQATPNTIATAVQSATEQAEGALPAGTYRVQTRDGDGLNLRSGPSTSTAILIAMPEGSRVTAKGTGANGFAAVDFEGRAGFAAAQYLVADSGPKPGPIETVTPSLSDLQVRIILTAWSELEPSADVYGGPDTWDTGPAGAALQRAELAQFQERAGLAPSGNLDGATKIALTRWAASHVAEVAAATAKASQGGAGPALPPEQPAPPPPPKKKATIADAAAPLNLFLGAGVLAALLYFGDKRRRQVST